jgi:3-dehydroquinate synthase
MEKLIRRCALLHLEHIRSGGDPFEFGSARPLDFGHWASHRLEVLSRYALGHGQAVAIGMALDAVYAMRRGLLDPRELERILTGLRETGLPVWDPLLASRDASGAPAILRGLEDFREHLGGVLTVTLPNGIGRKREVNEMDAGIVESAAAYLAERFGGDP